MESCIGRTALRVIFAVGLALTPAATASGDETQESRQPPAAQDDKSYLPPGMQQQGAAGCETPLPAENTDPGAKPKAKSPAPRRHRDNGFPLPGLGLFFR